MGTLARIEIVMLLQGVELFNYCSAEEVVRIAAIAQERRFETGDVIYEANEPADALYVLVDGGVSLLGPDESTQVVETKETFGVLEILSGRLRRGSARAESSSVTLAIEAEDFFDLLSNNIEIVKALFREVIQKSATGSGLK